MMSSDMSSSDTQISPAHYRAGREGERHILGFTPPRFWAFVLFAAVVVVAPFVVYPVFLMKIYAFIIFALGYNLLLGFTGLMSFGHAAFFGMGGYVAGWAATRLGLPFELTVLAGTSFAALMGLIFGWVAIRRTGLYFAMITLALAQMVYFVALQAKFTGGEDGLRNVPRGSLLGLVDLSSDTAMYWLMAAIVLLSVIWVNRIVHSPFGQVLRAVRENPARANGSRASKARLPARNAAPASPMRPATVTPRRANGRASPMLRARMAARRRSRSSVRTA